MNARARLSCGLFLGLVCWLAPCPALAQEAYPGQNNLAAGLTCYRNLDMRCAKARLETALAEFSPEKDKEYLSHVREARLILAMIMVAADELEKAENEFKTILLLEPGFKLPAGDHPPKVLYVLERAREDIAAQKKKATRPKVIKPPEKKDPPVKKPEKKPEPKIEKPLPAPEQFEMFSLQAEARLVALFGKDADVLTSGPGAALSFAIRTSKWLSLSTTFTYTYHSAGDENPALQVMALSLGGYTGFEIGAFLIRVGGGLGTLAMGTRDRYDHWGFTLGLDAALIWPAKGIWGLSLAIHPALAITADGSSFYLPVGLAGEVRW
jgi:hypothetical protein